MKARGGRIRHKAGKDDEVGFHSKRAIEEIDVARKALDSRAARAHLTLARQHLDRVRLLSGRPDGSG